jgi:hypothetical protein
MVGYVLPALIAVTVLIQAVAWGIADLGAHLAANHALQTARVLGGTGDLGERDGNAILTATLGSALTDQRITVDRGAVVATVTIDGTALSVIPFAHLPIHVSVQAPVEDSAGVPAT